MTTLLALDSSTDACSVALSIYGKVTHLFEMAAQSHTQRLLPMVDELLRAADCQLSDLDAIAFGRGPGSFTGLRICMGIVQGLAFGANIPVIPISTLQAMAQGYLHENPECRLPIFAALDARMEEIYGGLFVIQPSPAPLVPSLVPSADEFVMKPSLVCQQAFVAELNQEFVAIGPGWHYADLQPILPSELVLDVYPNAKFMVELAAAEFAKGNLMSVLNAQPVYLRDSISWQKRQRIRTEPL